MENHSFFAYNHNFVSFGNQHLIVILLMLFFCVALPKFAKKHLSSHQQLWLMRGMAVTISFWTLANILILIWLGDFNYKVDLPFDLCNIMGLLLPFVMWKPSYRVHEVIYFWIFAGTLQAIITPYLYHNFPNFVFIKYWVVHAGLVVFAVYVTSVFNLKPTLKSIWRSFWAIQLYVVFVFIINIMLDSNYVYILGKPPVPSALDLLGPWPWYILVVQFVGLLLFYLSLFPLLIEKRWKKRKLKG